MQDIQKYLDGTLPTNMNYDVFVKNNEVSDTDDEKVLSNIREFVANRVSDILFIKIEEDKIFLTKKEIKKLPKEVAHYLTYSEHRGIKIYVFTTKDWWCKKTIGVFGWSTWRANEWYFDQIIADETYQSITSKVSVKLTELLNTK